VKPEPSLLPGLSPPPQKDDVATCFDYYAGLAEKLDERQYTPVDVGMEEFSVKVGARGGGPQRGGGGGVVGGGHRRCSSAAASARHRLGAGWRRLA
jgi:hypothetical protein